MNQDLTARTDQLLSVLAKHNHKLASALRHGSTLTAAFNVCGRNACAQAWQRMKTVAGIRSSKTITTFKAPAPMKKLSPSVGLSLKGVKVTQRPPTSGVSTSRSRSAALRP